MLKTINWLLSTLWVLQARVSCIMHILNISVLAWLFVERFVCMARLEVQTRDVPETKLRRSSAADSP
jgi:hypothetical protein